MRFAGLGIPEQGRGGFIAAAVAGIAAFSLIGLLTALAPTFLGNVLHDSSHAVAGAVVFALLGAGAITPGGGVAVPQARPVMLAGLGLFLGRARPDHRRAVRRRAWPCS